MVPWVIGGFLLRLQIKLNIYITWPGMKKELGLKCPRSRHHCQPHCGVSCGRATVVTSPWNEVTSVVHDTLCIFAFAQVNVFAKGKCTGKSTEKNNHSGSF